MKSGGEPGIGDRLDAAFALAGVAALLFVGPLRGLFENSPLVLYLSALVLFFVPGTLICRCYLRDHFAGAASVPVAFVVSAAIFGLLAVPMLMLHYSLDVYIGYLRRKTEEAGEPRLIHTVRGVGYVIRES